MGPAGPGVPPGGTDGQVLSKVDGSDYNTEWTDPSGGTVIVDGAQPPDAGEGDLWFNPDTAQLSVYIDGEGWVPSDAPPVYIGAEPPVGIYPYFRPGSLWWESDTGNLYVYYFDGNSEQWVQIGGGGGGSGGSALVPTTDTPPDAPQDGQLWWESDTGDLFIWFDDGNSAQWVQVNGGSSAVLIPTDDVPPDNPQDGQLWWRSNTGALYIWYDDGDSQQWVQVAGGGGSSGSALVPTDDAPPADPKDGQLWWRSDKGQLYVWYDDGNSQQWVQANPTGKAAEPYPFSQADMLLRSIAAGKIGINAKADGSGIDLYEFSVGTFVVNASTTVNPSSGLFVNKATGTNAYALVRGQRNNKPRWDIWLGNANAESGSNLGSDYQIVRYDDAGNYIGSCVTISRQNGIFNATRGYLCQQGDYGAVGGNMFNFNWVAPGNLQLWIDVTNVGNVFTTSDYRTKKDVEALPSMWDVVKALKPVSYTQADFAPLFTADEKVHWGFIAHELQETMIDDAATAHKDAENEIQSPNPWTLLAALTKAFQEAMDRIEVLEAR